MTSELVKRLRTENSMMGYYDSPHIQMEAADRIEALERENASIRSEHVDMANSALAQSFDCETWRARANRERRRAESAEAERDRLQGILNTPELHDFSKAVALEAAHQRERWGSDHDAGKTEDDWYWLVAYLATKARQAITYKDHDKALHHIVTTAAALANWHAALMGQSTAMRPGQDDAKYAALEATNG